MALYGGHRCVEGESDFVGGELFLVAEEQGCALGFGEAGEELFELGGEGGGRGVSGGGVAVFEAVMVFELEPCAGVPARRRSDGR